MKNMSKKFVANLIIYAVISALMLSLTAQAANNNMNSILLKNFETSNIRKEIKEVIVAVLDTAIDINHPDLIEHIFVNEKELIDGSDNDNNGFVDDLNGWDFVTNTNKVYFEEGSENYEQELHGTMIAGIIAKTMPTAKILPLKIFENGASGSEYAIEAIKYAEKMGATIVNCSWGSNSISDKLKETIKNSNMIFFCAVGNEAINLDVTPVYPASLSSEGYENVVSVAAFDEKQNNISEYSNYGINSVDISANGNKITTTGLYSGYTTRHGTSLSVAIISGIAADIYAEKNYNATNAQIKKALIISSDFSKDLKSKTKNGRFIQAEF